MKHQDFVYQWTDKPYNYDTMYGPECVDLFKGYCRDVLKETITVGAGAAINYWNNIKTPFSTKWRQIIKGKEEPKQGDIVFFDTSQIEFGHVGVVHSTNSSKITIFDQIGNGEKVGGEKPCKLRDYPYDHIVGYWTLRPNPSPMEPQLTIEDLRAIWKTKKTRKFKDYSLDERTKMLIDISYGA